MKKLKKKKRSSKHRPVRYVRVTKERMRQLEALAAKRNPRKAKKKKKAKPRKTRRPSARPSRRNISPLVAALVEGAGYTIGHDAAAAVVDKRKRKNAHLANASVRRTSKVKRNPTHGVAVGSRTNPRFIAAGPKAQIHKLASALRSALGRSRKVMVGRVTTKH